MLFSILWQHNCDPRRATTLRAGAPRTLADIRWRKKSITETFLFTIIKTRCHDEASDIGRRAADSDTGGRLANARTGSYTACDPQSGSLRRCVRLYRAYCPWFIGPRTATDHRRAQECYYYQRRSGAYPFPTVVHGYVGGWDMRRLTAGFMFRRPSKLFRPNRRTLSLYALLTGVDTWAGLRQLAESADQNLSPSFVRSLIKLKGGVRQ